MKHIKLFEQFIKENDNLEMLKLMNKAMRIMPGSKKQKEIIKQLNVLRIANGLEPLKESTQSNAMEKIQALPQGKMFDDAKNIEGVFKRSKHSWHEVIETFEKNQAQAVETQIPIKDIQITQPNIQMNKVEAMLSARDLPPVNVVKFKDGYAIYDGHHRLITAWALGEKKLKIKLVTL